MSGNTKSVERTMRSIILKVDPDFERAKRNEIEYDFRDRGGRVFTGNPAKRGIYAPEEE